MKKVFFSALSLYASTCIAGDLDAYIKSEMETDRIEECMVLNEIQGDKAIKAAKETLKSLEGNLEFIEKIANNPHYQECVVVQEYIKVVNAKKRSAKKLRDKNELTRMDYENYTQKLESKIENLRNKEKKICQIKGEK